jgi:hypothetical protein
MSMSLCFSSSNKNETGKLYSLLWFFRWCRWIFWWLSQYTYGTTRGQLLIILNIFFVIWLGLIFTPASLMVLLQLLLHSIEPFVASCSISVDTSAFAPSLVIVQDKTWSRTSRTQILSHASVAILAYRQNLLLMTVFNYIPLMKWYIAWLTTPTRWVFVVVVALSCWYRNFLDWQVFLQISEVG